MKKIILTALVALFSFAHYANAQSSVLATLNHEGKVSTFYGSTALREAHAAASHGDVITLSSGTFVSTDITKAITLRGAGMDVDTLTKALPTIISGDFKIAIDIPDSLNQRLTMEGLFHNQNIYYLGNLNNPTFLKCRFFSFRSYNSSYLKNATFIHCIIEKLLELNTSCSAGLFNSYVKGPQTNSSSTSNFEFNNCYVEMSSGISTSSFKNCIIFPKYELISSCSAFNCIGYNANGSNVFRDIPNGTNKMMSSFDAIFAKEGFCELTPEAKKFKGTDGTEIGIHGGLLPFDPTPTNPQITKCNVAAKSTADGKLSVDIEVKAAE